MSEIQVSKFQCDLCDYSDFNTHKFVLLRPPHSHDKHLCQECLQTFKAILCKLLNGAIVEESAASKFDCGIIRYTIGNIEE